MDNNQILNRKERLKAFKKAVETWEKRKLLDVNSIPFDEVCTDLIITNSMNNKVNDPILVTIINSQESINIGLFLIPNQFDERNTQEKFISDFESVRDQFDALLLMSKDSNFTDFGFKEIVSNDRATTMTHYRNICFDFENFKDTFKSKSIVIMKTAIASGSNRDIEAILSAFAFPDFYSSKIVEIKNTIVCVASGNHKCTNDELNNIGKYSLNQIKRGAILHLDMLEDMSLENDIRASLLISGFDFIE